MHFTFSLIFRTTRPNAHRANQQPQSTGAGAQYGATATTGNGFTPLSGSVAPVKAAWPVWKVATIVGVVVVAAAAISVGIILGLKHDKNEHDECVWDSYKLPATWTASEYSWTVEPEFAEPFNFEGAIVMQAQAASETRCMVLNQHELNVHAVMFKIEAGDSYAEVDSVTMRDDHDQFIVRFPSAISAGQRVQLLIHYGGALGRNNAGLYLSTYEQDGKTVPMVVTQFEATAARRAFPCLDEPAFKANFSIAVDNVPPGYTALSNMPLLSAPEVQTNGNYTWRFQESTTMSTYLVALGVGRFISSTMTLPATAQRGPVDIGAWAREGFETELNYSLSALADILPYYEERFQIAFPLPKQDMLAIPDFAAGAMENWGLITYRESAMLGNVSTSAQSHLQRIAVVVAHELAHQWFGDLVTMDWWSSLWLNEGFATFTEYRGADHFDPSFQMLDQFVPTDPQAAMAVDAFGSSHALTREDVISPAQIEEMFDGISYSKGASVISMVDAYLGSDTFNNGIAAYLQAHAYGNAGPSDLWSALGDAAQDEALARDMPEWNMQPGFPLVSLRWADASKTALAVSQSRFFAGDYSKQVAENAGVADTNWWVPFTYFTQENNATQRMAFAENTAPDTVPAPAAGKWIKGNAATSGYYRVNYPVEIWEALRSYLVDQAPVATALSANDRSGLLSDLKAIVLSNVPESEVGAGVNATLLLRFASMLRTESTWTVWTPGTGLLSTLHSYLHGDDAMPTGDAKVCVDALSGFAAELLTPIVTAVGWDATPVNGSPEPPIRTLLRTRVLAAAVSFSQVSTTNEAAARYLAWKGGDTTVLTADTLGVAFSAAVQNNVGGTAWEDMKQIYKNNGNDATLLRQASGAMADSRNTTELQMTLDFALSADVRSQDSVSIVTAVAGSPAGRKLAWEFFKANYATFMQRYGQGGFALSNLVKGVSSHFVTSAMLQEVTAYFTSTPVEAAATEVAQAFEAINAHVAFLESQGGMVCAWLAENA